MLLICLCGTLNQTEVLMQPVLIASSENTQVLSPDTNELSLLLQPGVTAQDKSDETVKAYNNSFGLFCWGEKRGGHGKYNLHRPSFAGGDGEQCKKSPQDVIVVKLVLFPLSRLSCNVIPVIVQKLTSDKQT